jgi:general secretion pathway protein F
LALFRYLGLNQAGDKKSGVIEAENEKNARQLLRKQNLIPLKITATEQRSVKNTIKKISRKKTLSIKELTLITRQWATLMSAGLPLEETLTTVAEQTEKPATKSLIISVRNRVTEGHAFANALKHYPNAFSNLYCATIAAGEKSGHLEKVLSRLADHIEQQYQMRQKIQNALIYPAIMIIVAMGIVGFLLEYVVPKMIGVYSDTGESLPLLTQILIAISHGMQTFGIYIFIGIIVLVFLFIHQLKNNKRFQEKIHRLLLKMPILGNAIKTINTARFARTFAILFASGVSVIEAMNVSANLITNLPIRHAVEEATQRVKEGAAIHFALKQTGYFTPMSTHLIASGEASGQLEAMLERTANNQDADIGRLIETTIALFEPMIILVMGAIVLFIVLAVLLPIFQLNEFMN